MTPRISGVLLHISSLPSVHGIGDLGPAAHAFANLLADAGQAVWQFLPLNPTSPAIGNSPYSSPSAFAGNPLFISPERLLEEGFVSPADVDAAREHALCACPLNPFEESTVDYERVDHERHQLLLIAFERNSHRLETDLGFREFTSANADWLEDYARFMTIKDAEGGASWVHWPEPLARRDPMALAAWDRDHAGPMQRERFIQYLFFHQLAALRSTCRKRGIRLVGDAPIYVTHDSADVWSNPQFFKLDGAFMPTVVAGVPPDYFSPTGQRWGNPVYNWDALAADGFRWWLRRLSHNLTLVDRVRLDHFRGFAGYWEIPASEETAINGRWVAAPGMALFGVLTRHMDYLPFIAEDLGVITPDVRELQRSFSLPGMKVLQFAFGGSLDENPYVPFHHEQACVVYSGTHDNAPTRGWFTHASHEEKANLAAYVGHDVHEGNAHEVLMRLALGSVAGVSVLPMQDVLGLGMESRMNVPNQSQGNWAWRLRADQMRPESFTQLAYYSQLYARTFGRGCNC